MKRACAALIVSAAVMMTVPAADAYLKLAFTLDGRDVALRWSTLPVRYFMTNRDVPNVTALQLQDAVKRGFTAWETVGRVSLSSELVGFTAANPGDDDGISVIGFRSRPDLDRVLGVTSFQVDDVTGQLIEADIFLNALFLWSVAPTGESGRFDVQSVATHEIGHLFGLSHSALGETEVQPAGGRRVLGKQAVMFPIAFPAGVIEDRTLKADDAAGIGEIYRSAAFVRELGQISGRVTLGGRGLFGAHITALNTTTGTLIGGFSLDPLGTFSIGGLVPGLYVVRVEPLDDADLDGFFDEDVVVDIGFKPTYFSRLVAVPAGGTGPAIEIEVTAK